MTYQIDIVSELITVAPVVAVLIWVVRYFQAQLKKKDEHIAQLNDALRENERETISYVKGIGKELEKLNDNR